MTEKIFIRGRNSCGKTQWMLGNIGCNLDINFPTKFTYKPIHGYHYIIPILPEEYFIIHLYTDIKNNSDQILQKLQDSKTECKILMEFSFKKFQKIMNKLNKINITELYLNSMQEFQLKNIIIPTLIQRVFMEIRTDSDLEIMNENRIKYQLHDTTKIKSLIISNLNNEIKSLQKKKNPLQKTKQVLEAKKEEIQQLKLMKQSLLNKKYQLQQSIDQFKTKIQESNSKLNGNSESKILQLKEQLLTQKNEFISIYKQNIDIKIQINVILAQIETYNENTIEKQYIKTIEKINELESLTQNKNYMLQRWKCN